LKLRGKTLNWSQVWILQQRKSDSEFSFGKEKAEEKKREKGCSEVQSGSVVWVTERREIKELKFGSSHFL